MIFDLIQYAKQSRTINKRIPIAQFSKLDSLVVVSEDELAVDICFYLSDHGYPAVKGQVSGQVKLICQRCMQVMPQLVDVSIGLLLLTQEQEMPDIETNLEPYIYDSSMISLMDLVSDDIILSLPQVARHPEDICSVNLITPFVGQATNDNDLGKSEEPHPAILERAPRPFDVLKVMLKEK